MFFPECLSKCCCFCCFFVVDSVDLGSLLFIRWGTNHRKRLAKVADSECCWVASFGPNSCVCLCVRCQHSIKVCILDCWRPTVHPIMEGLGVILHLRNLVASITSRAQKCGPLRKPSSTLLLGHDANVLAYAAGCSFCRSDLIVSRCVVIHSVWPSNLPDPPHSSLFWSIYIVRRYLNVRMYTRHNDRTLLRCA